jgi:predicted Zn-dependent protease
MKRLLSLGVIVALLIAAIVLAQRRKPHAEVGPGAVLHFIGDTERELSRLPMSATRLSDADEIRIGNKLAERYKYMEGLRDDSDENKQFRRYIEKVGANVATRAQRKLPYKFHYIPEKNFVNAFAIPGGHVYIGQGLLDLMDSEDELAAVLGHEVEHIDRRHAVERLQIEARLRRLGLARLLVEIPLEIFQAGYSKEQELEADREGSRLAVVSGYSPTGTVRMFEAFDRCFREAKEQQARSPQEEAARVVLATMGEYFRSHPSSQERITQIQNLMAQEGWPAKSEKPFALAYLLWTDRAQIALRKHKYKEASGLASRALGLKPGLENALRIHGQAEYYQANFRRAADSYRDLLNLQPNNSGYIQYYAFLLSAADRHLAAGQFAQLIGRENNSYEALDSLAGLQLLADKPDPADKIYADLKSNPGDVRTPDRLAWLGWWYYVAGDSSRAFEMLESATQQRPSSVPYLVNFAWVAIEQRRYQEALSTLATAERQFPALNLSSYNAPYRSLTTKEATSASEILMAEAVAQWLAHDNESAISLYLKAMGTEPAWTSPAWYGPQYSPTISRAIAEMKAELDRRKKAAETSSRQAQ